MRGDVGVNLAKKSAQDRIECSPYVLGEALFLDESGNEKVCWRGNVGINVTRFSDTRDPMILFIRFGWLFVIVITLFTLKSVSFRVNTLLEPDNHHFVLNIRSLLLPQSILLHKLI